LEKYGDKAVIDLLKSNNLYLLIAETIENDGNKQPFKNASGDVTAKIDKEVLVKLAKNVLIVIGAMFIANKFLGYIKE